MQSSVVILLCRSEIAVGTTVTELGPLNAIGIIGFQGGRGQKVALNCQGQGGCGYHNGQQSPNSNHSSLTCKDLWHQLVYRCVSRKEIDGQPTKVLLELSKKKYPKSNELSSNLNHQNSVTAPRSIPRLEPVYKPRIP